MWPSRSSVGVRGNLFALGWLKLPAPRSRARSRFDLCIKGEGSHDRYRAANKRPWGMSPGRNRGAYKTVESRGTESVLNALILSSNDAQPGELSNATRMALENMWAEQQTTGNRKGAWFWLRFANEPWEADIHDKSVSRGQKLS